MSIKDDDADRVDSPALEELTSDGSASGLEVEREGVADGAIRVPFDPAKIDVITQARTIDLLIVRLREGELDLSPDFQRRANIWGEARKSSLIESILLRIPIPSLYVSEDKDGNYTVVDGLQRICAIAHFVDVAALNHAVKAKLDPLRLTGLQSLLTHKGKSFADLPRPLQRRISETELTLHIIRASTPGDVKFNIFSRINQGGLPLTAQEIRNAIYGGSWRTKIRELADSALFLTATEHKIRGERMEDLELVLRFIAHYTLDSQRPDEQNLDEFLNDTVERRSKLWGADYWAEIDRAFNVALAAAPKVFGGFPFRKYYGPGQNRRPINRGLFETETVLLARRTEDELARLSARSDRVLDKVAHLFNTSVEFINASLYATGRGSASNARLEILDNALNEVLDA
uniref:GmrSD restriction endonucleases N-terminal domain-containing protein n=1 Tax=Solibacter usitatus (strain Ellin6076) TaxID=234267 RepID=Q027Y6_SOLUE